MPLAVEVQSLNHLPTREVLPSSITSSSHCPLSFPSHTPSPCLPHAPGPCCLRAFALAHCYLVIKSCPTLLHPMDCSLPGSSVHEISLRQEYWSGLPFPSPGDLPNPGIQPMSLESPVLAGGFFTTESPGKSSAKNTAPLDSHSLPWSPPSGLSSNITS